MVRLLLSRLVGHAVRSVRRDRAIWRWGIEPLEPRELLAAATPWADSARLEHSDGNPAMPSAVLSAGPSRSMVLGFPFENPASLRQAGEVVYVDLSDTELWYSPGDPVLPVRQSTVLLPAGMEIASIEANYLDAGEPLAGDVYLAAMPTGLEPDTVTGGMVRYGGGDFPTKGAVEFSNRSLAGYSLGQLRVFPVRYQADGGTLTYHRQIELTLQLRPRSEADYLDVRQLPADRARVAALVDNPAALAAYDDAGPAANGGNAELPQPGDLPGYEYVIITNNSLSASFQPLLNQKLAKGLSAAIITTEWIYANYTGTETFDNASKIRQFIADAYTNQGTRWVLLGGDSEVIPARGAYASNSTLTNPALPTDLYYACLDGPWNGDGDTLWGEWTDGAGGEDVDLVADVFLGRVPVSNATEVGNFVAKTLLYETTTALQPTQAVILGEVVDGSTYGSASGIAIRNQVLPANWLPELVEHYDAPGYTWDKSLLIADLNASPHIITSLGHSSSTVDSRLTVADVGGLTNSFPYLFYSQGCSAGAFDQQDVSIGEKHIVSQYGAFATVMNTREGWYRQGTPAFSHFYALEFWDALFNEEKLHLGEAQQDAKDDNLWRVLSAGTYRWIHFTSTLFGDPETSFQLPTAPRVTGVTIGSSATAQPVYAVPSGSGAQLTTVPLGMADQVKITFDKPAVVEQGDLLVSGLLQGAYTVAGFSYDAPTRTATWTLAAPLPADLVTLQLNADGSSPVTGDGLRLDGEWNNPTDVGDPASSMFPSGDGAEGGDFLFSFTVLPGDANRDNIVDGGDYTLWADNYLLAGADWEQADFSGDQLVDGGDYTLWADNYLQGNSSWIPAESYFQSGTSATEARLQESDQSIRELAVGQRRENTPLAKELENARVADFVFAHLGRLSVVMATALEGARDACRYAVSLDKDCHWSSNTGDPAPSFELPVIRRLRRR